MKFSALLILSVTCCVAAAQNNDWFKGTWKGIRTFPNGYSTIGVPVRLEVNYTGNNYFSAKLIYMFPSDTTSRLVMQINGSIKGRDIKVLYSHESFLQSQRLRNMWSDCSDCKENVLYRIADSVLELNFTFSGCGDDCNGECVFRRPLNEYDSLTVAAIEKTLTDNKPLAVTGNKSAKTKNKNDKNKKQLAKDSVHQVINAKTTAVKKQADTTKIFAKAEPKSKPDSLIKTQPDSLIKIKTDSLIKNKADLVTKTKPDSLIKSKPATVAANNKKNKAATTPLKDSVTNYDTISPVVKKDSVPAAIIQRDTKLVTTYQVSSPHINVQLFDNGEIDYDAVSVYYNGKLIINNQTLTHKAITFSIEASAENRHHEFVLISESEGLIPPNTALMRITAGSQRYELEVSSSSKRNAKIAIDYTGN